MTGTLDRALQFSLCQESRRGARSSNQDRIAHCHSRAALLLLIADGMGGHAHGEVAAQIAARSVAAAFRRAARPRLADPGAFLLDALGAAHDAIVGAARKRGLAEAPRTTCVACVVQDGHASWAHAGDSRLYWLRAGAVLAQTKDHTLLQRLIDRGRVAAHAIEDRPERNQIYNCLGSARPPRLELSQNRQLNAGDSLILCSDGLWGPLSAETIADAVLQLGIMRAVPALMDEAERRAGRECDNLSAVGVRWEDCAPATFASRQGPIAMR